MEQTRMMPPGFTGLLVSLRPLLLYGATGVIGTAVHFLVLFAALGIAAPVLASTLGAVAGCVVNYFLARHYVFGSTGASYRSFPRFVAVAMIGIMINGTIIQTFINTLPLAVNQLIASSTVLFTGFLMNKWWTFNGCQN